MRTLVVDSVILTQLPYLAHKMTGRDPAAFPFTLCWVSFTPTIFHVSQQNEVTMMLYNVGTKSRENIGAPVKPILLILNLYYSELI